MKNLFLALGLIAAPLLAPLSANALSVNTLAQNGAAWAQVNTQGTVTLPKGGTWTSAPIQMPNTSFPQIDPCISFCSPFDPKVFGTGQSIGSTPLANWQTIPFWATWQTADRSNTNILSFGTVQKSLSLLWGSMDVGNLIEFVLNGKVVGTLAGDQLPGVTVGNPGRGAALISVSNLFFNEVRFSSTSGGFEYSNITASPVPLPLPVFGLMAGLGGLALMRGRRRA